MSNRGQFYCLNREHNHQTKEEEIECSASFQIDRLEAEIERLNNDNQNLRASLGAIHYHAHRKRLDVLPILSAITRECERSVPELVTILNRIRLRADYLDPEQVDG